MFEVSIVDKRQDAESKLTADLAAIPESHDIEAYLPAFNTFSSALFDAEAEEHLDTFEDEEAFKAFLRQELEPPIIEGIMPDRGLESVKAKWSPEVARLSIENEIGSEIILESGPNGATAPAREEIQSAYAQHGEWENFAPPTVRFRLRYEKNGLVRESLRQVLERRLFYWLGRFSLRPVNSGSKRSRAGRGVKKMFKRSDFLEQLSPDDPDYEIVKRFYLEAWSNSHGLVADAYAGRLSLSDFVEGCVGTFDQGAQARVAAADGTSIAERCREIDRMAKKFIRKFNESLAAAAKRFGKAKVTAAIDDLSRRSTRLHRVQSWQSWRKHWPTNHACMCLTSLRK